ncbi:hypothetical protein J31TS6_24800 [Brevibacillus reuszeri]|nr:hypothetical protein J31TS6_24800 [Brevibacillus reuszeri]
MRGQVQTDRGVIMNELFICQWCGYVEEIVISDESAPGLLQCSCCRKEEVDSLFAE